MGQQYYTELKYYSFSFFFFYIKLFIETLLYLVLWWIKTPVSSVQNHEVTFMTKTNKRLSLPDWAA